ncbi:MAG: GTP-binding protein [Promethearchaeota archaeon]|nr:MAG: GTP-binding protein [Candidatus Lokiarchaeota archaeon]
MEGIRKEPRELTYKISIFGDRGVGKTTLVNRYITCEFHEDTLATLGATIHIKYLELEKGKLTLQIWDFGGQKRFKFLISSYARGSAGGIFMFDLTNYESLMAINEWLPEFGKTVRYIPLIMVGSKLDLEQKRVCKKNQVLDIIKSYKFHKYIECSSKTGENVELVFKVLLRKILDDRGYKHLKFK